MGLIGKRVWKQLLILQFSSGTEITHFPCKNESLWYVFNLISRGLKRLCCATALFIRPFSVSFSLSVLHSLLIWLWRSFLKGLDRKNHPLLTEHHYTSPNGNVCVCVDLYLSHTHTYTHWVKIQIYAQGIIGSDTRKMSEISEWHILSVSVFNCRSLMMCHIFELEYIYGNQMAAEWKTW